MGKPGLQEMPAMRFLRKAGDEGNTLVEVLIALAIFTIGILAVLSLLAPSIRGNTSARFRTIAATTGSDCLERLIRLPYAHADLVAGNHAPAVNADGFDNDYDGEIDEAAEDGSLRISWQVTDNSPILQTKTIRVDVSWRDPLRQRSLSLVSYKADL